MLSKSFASLAAAVFAFQGISEGFMRPVSSHNVIRMAVAAKIRTPADSRADFARHKDLWKGFVLKEGYKSFAAEFSDKGQFRFMDDVSEGRQQIESFLETWPVVWDMKRLTFEEPMATANSYVAKWKATWSSRVGMKGETEGIVFAVMDNTGKIVEYSSIADADEFSEYLDMMGYGGNQ